MTIDDLIDQLQKAQAYCGDVEAVIIDPETGWANDIHCIEIEEYEGNVCVSIHQEID